MSVKQPNCSECCFGVKKTGVDITPGLPDYLQVKNYDCVSETVYCVFIPRSEMPVPNYGKISKVINHENLL